MIKNMLQAVKCTDKNIEKYLTHLESHMPKLVVDSNQKARIYAAFLSQICVESGCLSVVEENLNYSSEGLMKIWPSRFNKDNVQQYARNPKSIANTVYNGRMGNAFNSNDGWLYRGRGLIQITGKFNYTKLSMDEDIDCLVNPDILLQPEYAVQSAIWFFKTNNIPSKIVLTKDTDAMVKTVTKIVNGGLIHFDKRLDFFNKMIGVV